MKPGIENANKLILRFIPKGTNIAEYSSAFIRSETQKLNQMSQMKLEWSTPNKFIEEKKTTETSKETKIPQVMHLGGECRISKILIPNFGEN